MPTLKEYRDIRLEKLNKLTQLGVDPYPPRTDRNHDCGAIAASYKEFAEKPVVVAGRITSLRGHGKLIFFDIKEASGSIQIMVKADELKQPNYANSELGFKDLNLLDIGDFVEIAGKVTKTKKDEISILADTVRILVKSLRPMPSEWSGLKDKETRLRRRYLDTNINDDVRQRFIRRSKFWQSHRDFLNSHGFLEINVPVLEHTTGGADAKPFKTHMDVLDQDFYLRISHELPLKRLIGGGYEKVYDIGPRFRNEHYTDEHLPEHVAMEFYWAYADWQQGMKLVQELIRHVAKDAFGTTKFKLGEGEIDLSTEWEKLDFSEVMREHYDIDVFDVELKTIQELLKRHKIETTKQDNIGRGIDKLWKEVRNRIAGPAFLVNIPKLLSPLAKASPENTLITERFQPIIGGTENGTGWSELNDPQDQLARFKEQQELRDKGDEEAQMLDIDYVEMLEYGMPPTFGYGHSERLFWLLEGVSAREGVPFPQLRHEIDKVTKSIYPDLFKGKK